MIDQDTFFATQINTGLVNDKQTKEVVRIMTGKGYNIAFKDSPDYANPDDCGNEFMIDWNDAIEEAEKI